MAHFRKRFALLVGRRIYGESGIVEARITRIEYCNRTGRAAMAIAKNIETPSTTHQGGIRLLLALTYPPIERRREKAQGQGLLSLVTGLLYSFSMLDGVLPLMLSATNRLFAINIHYLVIKEKRLHQERSRIVSFLSCSLREGTESSVRP
jgi:hypothetical protein